MPHYTEFVSFLKSMYIILVIFAKHEYLCRYVIRRYGVYALSEYLVLVNYEVF